MMPKLMAIQSLSHASEQYSAIGAPVRRFLFGLNGSARILSAEGVDFELVLAGDGEMRAEIEAFIDDHKPQSIVRITGWISSDQVRNELLAARALVLPNFAEGLPW
jgi:glycosyltransferase involved in cell wall biosynthesis